MYMNHQLKKLKLYTKNKSVYYDNGAHLGFLYRAEFLEDLRNKIKDKINEKGNEIISVN